MVGFKISLRNQTFLSGDNWGKIRKIVILVSVVKSGILTFGGQAWEFYNCDRGIHHKTMSELPNAFDVSKLKKNSLSTNHCLNFVKKKMYFRRSNTFHGKHSKAVPLSPDYADLGSTTSKQVTL